MKILVVSSGNVKEFNFILHHAFVYEQIEFIKKDFNIEYDTFFIKGKGIKGYLKNISTLNRKILNFKPDIVHAHFGLSGLLACMQRKSPVVITFHGSDVNLLKVLPLSMIAAKLARYNIYVSDKIHRRIKVNSRYAIVPCGINLDIFYPIEMKIARKNLNMDPQKKYILFNSSFDREVKNSSLAFSAIKKLSEDCELIELTNSSRDKVNLLLNACNLVLLTSISEGSPQVIKEAMACNCPIVATDVGDIKEVIADTEGCYITSFDPDDVADKIKLAFGFGKRTNGRKKIMHFDNKIIAKKIFNIYQAVVDKV